MRVYDANANFLQQHGTTRSGPIQGQQTAVFYPANLSTTLAVGASTDFDYRSHYSQYDSTLTFVACSGGGIAGIYTTDRTGTAGYNQDDQDPNNNPNYVSLSGTSAASPLAAGIAALVLSKNGNQNVNVVSDKLKTTCDKIGPVAYTGTAPYTRNDYYGYGRLNANAAVNAATADITAPTFHSATVIHHRAVDVAFNEPMGDGVENPNNYTITAGQGTLSAPNPAKVVRIGKVQVGFGAWLNVYRLIWNSGSLAGSGTVTITASSALKDVAGNSLSGTLSRSGTGTKRVLAVNSGSALELSYTVPYLPYLADNGFQGNEVAKFLTSTADVMTTDSAIDTSGVTDPAPQAVYQSQRISWNSQPVPITWSLPDMPPESLKVRLHFAEIYYAHDQYGYQLFDIHINDILKTSGFDIMSATGGQQNKAVVLEYSNITPQNGVITVTLMPQQGANGDYRAAINGIEVVKP